MPQTTTPELTVSNTVPLQEVERVLREDIKRSESAIREIERQLATLDQQRSSNVAPALTGSADPVAEAQAAVEAERQARDLAAQQSALYAVLAKYQASLTRAKQQLAEVQNERGLKAAQAVVDATNQEMLTIALEIEEVRRQHKELLIKACKAANSPEMRQALRTLRIDGYLDLWLTDRSSDGFDSPNLCKMSGMKLTTGEAIADLESDHKWSIVSQGLVSGRELK